MANFRSVFGVYGDGFLSFKNFGEMCDIANHDIRCLQRNLVFFWLVQDINTRDIFQSEKIFVLFLNVYIV